MNQNSFNEVDYYCSQTNTNTIQSENSKFDKQTYSSDNFWTVDPFIFGDQNQNLQRDFSASQPVNNNSNWLSEMESRKCSNNVSNECPNPDDPSGHPAMSVSKDQNDPKFIFRKQNKRLYRKLPIHFIDTKDWQSYMELATIRNASIANHMTLGLITNGMTKPGKFKNNKVHRLLNSIYNLYQEYNQLSDEYEKLHSQLSAKYLSSDSLSSEEIGFISINDPSLQSTVKQNKKLNLKQKPMKMNIPETHSEQLSSLDRISNPNSVVETTSTCSQTIPVLEWSELTDSQLADVAYNPEQILESTKRWSLSGGGNVKRNNISISNETSISSSKSKRLKIYDHLTRKNFLGEQEIDVMEELLCNRITLNHKMNLIANSNDSHEARNSPDDTSTNEFVNHPNFIFNSIATALRCTSSRTGNNSNIVNSTLINLPIIVDLMLPKTQMKIRQIFEECSFLNNPLEIMAELRFFNYNKNATIEHFKNTKQLRSTIKEFFNNNIDSRSRLVVLRCLYRNFYHYSDKNSDLKHLISCSNCGKEFLGNDYYYSKGNIKNDKGIYMTEEDELKYLKLFDEQNDCFYPLHSAEACDAEIDTVEMHSKYTVIEPGIFDNGVCHFSSQTENIETQLRCDNIKNFVETISGNVAFLKISIKESKAQMTHLRRQVSSLLKALKSNIDLIINLSSKHFMSDQHRNRIILLARQVEELKLKLKEEETKRRMVYNLMQEQMGNVRVYCRCRDIVHNENVLEIQGNESIVLPILPQERFDFDKVFPSNMSQSEIYEEFRPLVMSFIDGFNVCFITYGSEASGKTYTLIGGNFEETKEHGIMQRTLNTLLTEQELRNRDWDYQITACLVEIYNDNCIDILSGECGIQLYVDCGMESVYQKLKSVPITNETDTEVLLQLCRVKRKIAKTALNPASSRSHLITLIRLQGKSKIHGENIRSFMCLCDLAGFEDIIKAETQSNKTLSKEAGYINKSLTAFNRVFVSLRRQDPNTVCYRDTKLTHFLKPFLTNSGKCALVITIRTDRRSLSSTQNTLRFGRETRGVSLGKARRQVNINQQ